MSNDSILANRRVLQFQGRQQVSKGIILFIRIRLIITALQFNSDTEVIALLSATPARQARVPGTLIRRHELDQFSPATNQEMSGDLQFSNLCEIRMRISVEGVGKQRLDITPTILSRRQGNTVQNDKIGHAPRRPDVTIRGDYAACPHEPAVLELPMVQSLDHKVILSHLETTLRPRRGILLNRAALIEPTT